MKNIVFVLMLALAVPLFMLGCDDGNNSSDNQDGSRALTENNFTADGSLRAEVGEDLVVTYLESPDAEPPQDDTGVVGVDEIPYRFPFTGSYTICWEDDDFAAEHFMELKDSEGTVILTLEANGDCVTEIITAGTYTMFVHNDGRLEDTLPIFLIPDSDTEQQAANTDGILNRFIEGASSLLSALNISLHEEAMAQPPDVLQNIDILMSTRRCDFCNLKGVGFGGVDLSNVSMQKADLRDADLRSAKLNGASLGSSILSDADMRKADLTNVAGAGAIMSGANLDEAILTGANFFFSNFESATLRDANLQQVEADDIILLEADLTGADLTDASFMRADFGGANLSFSDLIRTNFTEANIIGATLIGADMTQAVLSDTSLNGSLLANANLTNAFLDGADLLNVNLQNANLNIATVTNARLISVNLIGANLTGATFQNSTWCDECICEAPSVGTCTGCPPAEDVCTGPDEMDEF